VTSGARVRHRMDAEVSIVEVEGDVDIANVADVEDGILQAVPNHAVGLVLDLSPTTYIDSQGMRLLVAVAERLRSRRQRLIVVAPAGSFVRRIIELSQLQALFPLLGSASEAIAALHTA
jgi:anti-sigma B factor antagonist